MSWRRADLRDRLGPRHPVLHRDRRDPGGGPGRRGGWAQLDTGPGQLALERVDSGDEEGRALVGRFVGVSLAVANVELAYRRLRDRGVEFPGPPEQQAWGGLLAHFRDPDGTVITLVGRAP
jgi:Glyoxalase/Bleomycin resistance protein/Dioxygenase superfamily